MRKLFSIVFAWLGPLALFVANVAVSEHRVRVAVVLAIASLLVHFASLFIGIFVGGIVVTSRNIDREEDPGRFHDVSTACVSRTRAVIRWLFLGAVLAVQLNVAPF